MIVIFLNSVLEVHKQFIANLNQSSSIICTINLEHKKFVFELVYEKRKYIKHTSEWMVAYTSDEYNCSNNSRWRAVVNRGMCICLLSWRVFGAEGTNRNYVKRKTAGCDGYRS